MEALGLGWLAELAKQGIGYVLFVIASVVIWWQDKRIQKKDDDNCRIRTECDNDIKLVYEARLTDMNRLLDRVNTLVAENTSTLAANSRVVESRAEAITAMKEVLTKLVIMQESDSSARRSQADRIEGTIGRLTEIVRPTPPKVGLQ